MLSGQGGRVATGVVSVPLFEFPATGKFVSAQLPPI